MASAKKKSKKVDLISERARTLNDQIAMLEAQIKKLDGQLQSSTAGPRLRSTALPHGMTVPRKHEPPPAPKPMAHEPVFESINQEPIQLRVETESSDHYNELGARKYDLPALWTRLRNHFRRPTTTNPRLVNYLAAGGVQGLRPLRYEKRVARNRVLLLAGILFAVLLGILLLYLKHR